MSVNLNGSELANSSASLGKFIVPQICIDNEPNVPEQNKDAIIEEVYYRLQISFTKKQIIYTVGTPKGNG